jgi:hypothetical protein
MVLACARVACCARGPAADGASLVRVRAAVGLVPASYPAFGERLRALAAQHASCTSAWVVDDEGVRVWDKTMAAHINRTGVVTDCEGWEAALHTAEFHTDPYAPFAYDAAYALAHGLHTLLEMRGRSVVVGEELLDALLANVSFSGATGDVSFYDPGGRGLQTGDRVVGVRYTLVNHQGAGARSFVPIGSWRRCANEPCGWAQRWTATPNATLVFSTADNTPPPTRAPLLAVPPENASSGNDNTVMAVAIIGTTLGSVLCVALLCVLCVVEKRRSETLARRLRLAGSNKPPEIPLEADMLFHLFLSHVVCAHPHPELERKRAPTASLLPVHPRYSAVGNGPRPGGALEALARGGAAHAQGLLGRRRP